MSTDGLYLVFCLSGQREVSGKPLPHTGKGSGGLGSGQKLQGQAEHCKDRGPETHSCVAMAVQEEGLAAGDTQVIAGTPTKARETQQQFFCSYVCLKTPPGSCSSLMIMVLGLTLGGP